MADFLKDLVAKIAAFFGQVLVAIGFTTDAELEEAGKKAEDFANDWEYIIKGE